MSASAQEPIAEIPSSPELKFVGSLPAALLLSTVGGSVEGFVYLSHGHVFAAVLSGNIILLGVGLFRHSGPAFLNTLVPTLAFPAGLLFARLFQTLCQSRFVSLGLLYEALGLFIASLLPSSWPDMAFVAIVAFVVAYQVASFRKEDGQFYGSTYIMSDLRSAIDGFYDLFGPSRTNEARKKYHEFGLILLAFFAGAAISGFLGPRLHNHTLWFPDALLLLLFAHVLIRSRAAAFR